jgi:hypothetical protein
VERRVEKITDGPVGRGSRSSSPSPLIDAGHLLAFGNPGDTVHAAIRAVC